MVQSYHPYFFCKYTFPIFKKSYKQGYTEEDLFELPYDFKSKYLGNKLETTWKKMHSASTKNSLLRALVKMFGVKFLLYTWLTFVNENMMLLVTPNAVGKLVSYFDNNPNHITKTDAYLNGVILVLSRFIHVVVHAKILLELTLLYIQIQSACVSLIYRKILRLNQSLDATAGQVITLISNDVNKFDRQIVFLPTAILAPIQIVIATYLAYKKIGVSALIGTAGLVAIIPIQILLAKLCSKIWAKILPKTEKRLLLIKDFIAGAQVIKMFCWQKCFQQLISAVRSAEMTYISSYFYVMAILFALRRMWMKIPISLCIWNEVLRGQSFTTESIFIISTIFLLLGQNVLFHCNFAYVKILEIFVLAQRIQTFLCLEEQRNTPLESGNPDSTTTLFLKNVSAKWLTSQQNTLKDISFACGSNQLVAVTGPVGSGKSSFLNLLLNEIKLESGCFSIKGTTSYFCQDSWVFPGTVRQNIVFNSDFDEERYLEVVKVCALESDFRFFPFGDQTLITDFGRSLSGGQKARINLARCIYREADVYLLDDPLSAVDVKVGKYIFQKCVKNFLKGKLCFLVTHNLQHLRDVDDTIVISNGRIIATGPYNQLDTKHLNLITPEKSLPEENDENEKITEISLSNQKSENEEEHVNREPTMSLYVFYLKLAKGFFNIFGLLTLCVCYQFFFSGIDYYVAYWNNFQKFQKTYTNTTVTSQNRKSGVFISLELILLAVIFGFAKSLYLIQLLKIASTNLHKLCLLKLVQTKTDFLLKNSPGKILNRFSEDFRTLEQYLPTVFLFISEELLLCVGVTALITMIDFVQFFPLILFFVIGCIYKKIYIKTHRDSKRIESRARSPIFNQVVFSMSGLSTIRAFKAEKTFTDLFNSHSNIHFSAKYAFEVFNRGFAFWVDILSTFFSGIALLILFSSTRDFSGADVGLLITQHASLIICVQWGLRQWAETETELVCLERLHEMTTIESEPQRGQNQKVSSEWPQYGKIEFRKVSLKYGSEGKNAIQNVSLAINAEEKIGIVGRTGAGKSSLVTSLFQLYQTEGNILIDDVDISQVPLETLRSKISIIPQEPFLFFSSLRKNLDPLEEYSDDVLWATLEQVQLKNTFHQFPDGLHHNIKGGLNLSVGQKQLICLARALLKNNKILVMDEATANVDPHTDEIIQKSVRKRFANCTVLTIAHRLNTVMDSDRILVMNEGRVEEFDSPQQLLRNENGVFYNLARSSEQY